MTVKIEIDEKMWAEAEEIAEELNIDYSEMFLNTLRQNLYNLREAKRKRLETDEKARRHYESYKKFPVEPEEFYVGEEQLIVAWKDL